MNSPSPEFEVKVALLSVDDASELLQSCSFLRRENSSDIYFDTAERDLFARGVFVRLRDSAKLEVKYNSDPTNLDHLLCGEIKYSWPLQTPERNALTAFLGSHLGAAQREGSADPFMMFALGEFVRITKHRSIYLGSDIEISVDQVENLGTFLEVEAKGPNGVQRVTEFCARHGLTNLPLGYVELWLRKHDFATYRQGKYILAKDKRATD